MLDGSVGKGRIVVGSLLVNALPEVVVPSRITRWPHQGLTRRTAPTSPPPRTHTGTASEAGIAELFGPPEAIIAGLEALQAVGVSYVLISGGEARQSMQRLGAEVMAAFLPASR